MGTVEWGVWKDANASANKYWYWGFLRKYIYVFPSISWNLHDIHINVNLYCLILCIYCTDM